MMSSDRLPPPPLMFVGATAGTKSNQEKRRMAIIKVFFHHEEFYFWISPEKNRTQAHYERVSISNKHKLCLHISRFLRERTQCLIHGHTGSKIE